MKNWMLRVIDLAVQGGARYADIRVVRNTQQHISVKNGVVDGVQSSQNDGFGVRVLVGNGWGFAGSSRIQAGDEEQVVSQALEIAAASNSSGAPSVDLGPIVTSAGVYVTPCQIDPFSVPLNDKISLLLAADAALRDGPNVRTRTASMIFQREQRLFANSEGAFTDQTIIESGGGIQAVAVGKGEIQTRSYPNSFGRNQLTGGYEVILGWDFPANAPRIADEASALLSAAICPADLTTTLILGGGQLALQIHESCGHAAELDRVFGSEAAYAGTSFLTLEKLGGFQYGSPFVNITADSLRPKGLGTYGWDDEGVPAQSVPLVKEGRFVNYLTSRESAARLGQVSNGCMRASSWNRMPIIRMPNISLEPGVWDLQDLIADTDEGIYMETNRSWSIDDRRLNFQFGTEIGYEIKHGKRVRMLRNPIYTGNTPEFWNSCDAVCNADHWQMWGTPNCGKGQPSQTIHTGHGAAPARFREVSVGVMK